MDNLKQLVMAASMAALSSQAMAAATIEVTAGVDSVTIVDNSSDDNLDSVLGIVGWQGLLGGWLVTTSNGLSDATVENIDGPGLQKLVWNAERLSGDNDLSITFTDTWANIQELAEASFTLDYSGPIAVDGYVLQDGATLASFSFSTTDTSIGTSAEANEFFSFTDTTPLDTLVSLQMVFSDGNSGGGLFQVLAVSEPATLALFGLGLAGLGMARRKQSNA